MTRFGFAVVDENLVAIAVPGYSAVDGEPYSDLLLLKHLVVIDESEIASVFGRIVSLKKARDPCHTGKIGRVFEVPLPKVATS